MIYNLIISNQSIKLNSAQRQRLTFIAFHKQIIEQKINHSSKYQISQFKRQISAMIPDESLPVIIQLLYEHLLQKYQFDPEEHELQQEEDNESYNEGKTETSQEQSKSVQSFSSFKTDRSNSSFRTYKSRSEALVFSKGDAKVQYILQQTMPPLTTKQYQPYDSQQNPYFDQIFPNQSESEPPLAMRYQEKRFVVNSFITRGYGLVNYQKDIKNRSFNCLKRYKTVLYGALLACVKSIETFMIRIKGKDILTLKQLNYHFPSILANLQKYFPQKMVETFFQCLKMNFSLETNAPHRDDVQQFHQQFCDVVQLYKKNLLAFEKEKKEKHQKKRQQKSEKKRQMNQNFRDPLEDELNIVKENVKKMKKNLRKQKKLTEDNRIKAEEFDLQSSKEEQLDLFFDDISDIQ